MVSNSSEFVSGIRLQKILSVAGIASRRAAERLMEQGRVTVNGRVVTKLGTRADLEHDNVSVDGQRIRSGDRRRYLLMNKPRGYVTTRHDPERRRTVLDLVPRVREYVYPIGRLDYDSEGLLLLTNDGELAYQLTHPRQELERVYEVVVFGVPASNKLQRLSSGMSLGDPRRTKAIVRLLGGHRKRNENQARVSVTLREGRNRQVRRMFAAIGHPVIRLRRIQFGPIKVRDLALGDYRDLSLKEIKKLRLAVTPISGL